MKKFIILLTLFFVVTLSGCGSDETAYNFDTRKDDYFISDDGKIIIEYKTNEDGKLVEINIDRLLEIEDIIYFDPTIDYEMTVEGFTGDIFVSPRSTCVDHNDILVPINIEIGSTTFKFDRIDCEYQEVDRYNEIKTSSFARSYGLEDTIDVSKSTIINIVVYDEGSIEKFREVKQLKHTNELIGVYNIVFNYDRNGFVDSYSNYGYEMTIYEQLLLKTQDNEEAINDILGLSSTINLLDFDELLEAGVLIDNFEIVYELEINAVIELFSKIGVAEEVIIEDDIIEEEPIDEIPTGDSA
ncbi:MAG: hypothetical protein QM489_03430 [Candidatus Izemoplasma sp.]